MSNLALVTGASSGIGEAIARHHASMGGDLIITARREPALLRLKQELEVDFGTTVQTIALDLGVEGGAEKLIAGVDGLGLTPNILISNAGFGGHGLHIERALADEMAIIDLNVKALVTLSHAFGQRMAAKGAGRILHVGSTAGFMPGPQQAIYFATKAFVNSFSQALDHELRPKGVTSTVLAPGGVKTEFAQVADLTQTPLMTNGGAEAAAVAKIGYDAMMDGKLLVINEKRLRFLLNWVLPFLSRRRVLKMVDRMQTKTA